MPPSQGRTINLPAEQATYIDSLVAAGTYATADEVVEAGLRALRERADSLEDWLRDEVLPVYDAMRADPGRAITADQVAADLRAHHEERLKRSVRDH